MNQEHYISKLERNTNVLDKAPEHIKQQCSEHIIWARNLIARLEQLDYQEREKAIAQIHNTLDTDYQAMGFTTEQSISDERKI